MNPSAEAVAAAAASCPGVARLSRGVPVEVATYLPGRRIYGVRIDDRSVEVHVVACPGTPLPELAAEIRQAVSPIAPKRAIDVFVDDIELGPEDAACYPHAPPVER
jgi:hypothetical protein